MKKALALLLTAIMALSLVACGGGKNETNSGAGTDATNSGVGTDAGTPNVDAIVESGKLVMLTNATFPPYEYLQGGEVAGVDADLAKMIADELGVELEILDMDFDLLTDAVNSGKGDLIAAGMSVRPDREKFVDFSINYVDTNLLILVAKDNDITGPDDLDGKKIAVQESTTSDLFVTDEMAAEEVMRFKNAVDTGTAVKNGKADAAVIDEETAINMVNANDGDLILLDDILANENYAMAVAKDKPDLVEVINKVLAEQVENGTVEELIAKHMEESKL